MKYIVIYEVRKDIFTTEFSNKKKAIEQAKDDWRRMTTNERKNCREFSVLESFNPDAEAEDHFNGNTIWAKKLRGEFVEVH